MFNHSRKPAHLKPSRVLWRILQVTGFTKFIASFVVYLLIAAVGLYIFEPSITNIGDSIWYCFVTSTTLGYGDIVVTTIIGRVISVFLALYGLLFFGCLSGIVVSYYLEMNKRLSQYEEHEKAEKSDS
ncbi:potassium channel family protein [Granulicatella seriolae]|jgi:voltage-gated potassium channel|uniref:Potassium channel family protein n=1 Tax=Granulicatella seriolae TaxID=2967226 RepID=A0ABT1WP31_9LACT|nr:potassium channel family protein [Granulicatella seriolae]